MKKIYAIVLLLCVGYALQAQMSIGLSFATPGWRPLNTVIDRYNNLRPWLDKEMGNIGFMPGWTIAPGFVSEDGKIAFQICSLRKSSTRVTAKGADAQRDLSVRLWTFSVMDATYYPIRLGRFSIGGGVQPVEISRLKIRGRVDDGKFETYWKSPAFSNLFLTNASSTLHADMRYKVGEKNAALHFRLYWMLSWFNDEHMVFVNDKLNGSSISGNTYSTQNMGCSHIGFQLLYDVF